MKNYLPIGSVVALKGGGCDMLIYGRQQISPNRDRVWDYCACPHPYGNLPHGQTAFFDEADIERVLFRGYSGEEEVQMHGMLSAFDTYIEENGGEEALARLLREDDAEDWEGAEEGA